MRTIWKELNEKSEKVKMNFLRNALTYNTASFITTFLTAPTRCLNDVIEMEEKCPHNHYIKDSETGRACTTLGKETRKKFRLENLKERNY
jgi:hypothetical protein